MDKPHWTATPPRRGAPQKPPACSVFWDVWLNSEGSSWNLNLSPKQVDSSGKEQLSRSFSPPHRFTSSGQKYHRIHLTDLAFPNLGCDLGTRCTDPRPPTRQAIHSLHSLSRLPGNVNQLEHLELGLLDVQVFVEAAALTPLGHYRQVVLRHVPHEEQDVHVPGFAGGGGTKGSALQGGASCPRAQPVCPDATVPTTPGLTKQARQTAPTQPLLWASRAAARVPAWTAEKASPPSSTDPPSSPQGSQGLHLRSPSIQPSPESK